jgi:hypothetical protein
MDNTTRAGGRNPGNSRTTPGAVADPMATGNDARPGQESGAALKDRIRQTANTQLNRQKDRATDELGNVARAVRETTQQLRERNQATAAHYIEQAANQLQRVSERLKNKDVGELLSDAQRLARRQPALFIGGAFALGLIGARFFKSSPPDADRDYDYPTVGAAGIGDYERSAPLSADLTSPARETSRLEDF